MMDVKEKVISELKPIIADILGLEPDEVTASSRFFEDLGGESIDVLDLAFRCEKHFQVKVPVQKLGAPLVLLTDASGIFTSEAMSALRERFPFADPERVAELAASGHWSELITVEAITCLVATAVAARGAEPAPDKPGDSSPIMLPA